MAAGRPRLVSAAVIAAAVAVAAVWILIAGTSMPAWPGFASTMQAVEAYIRSFGAWSMAASVLLMVLHSFVPFPAEAVGMANGMIYGPVVGTALTWSGAMLGAWAAFGLAKLFGRPLVLRLLPARHQAALDRFAAEAGGPTLFFSRFVPIISFNLINYAAGLTAMSWWTFTWATALGILPITVLVVLAGDGMGGGESSTAAWLFAAAALGWLAWFATRRYLTRS